MRAPSYFPVSVIASLPRGMSHLLGAGSTDTLRRETVGLKGLPPQKARAIKTCLPGSWGAASSSS